MIKYFLGIVIILFISCDSNIEQRNIDYYKNSLGINRKIKNEHQWEKKKKQILKGMEEAMGTIPFKIDHENISFKIIDESQEYNYNKYTIQIILDEGEILPAYLYVPKDSIIKAKSLAAMLVLHSTGELGKKFVDGFHPLPNRAIAKELALRGYIVIAPDYPSMGDLLNYDFSKDKFDSGTMKGIYNHIKCIDLLQSLEYVNPNKIGVIGHSLGGHNAIFLGAYDDRVKVVVSSCGWTLMDYFYIGEEASIQFGGRLGSWAQEKYMPLLRDKFDLNSQKFPFDFDGLIAAIAPRYFFSNSPINDSNFNVDGVVKGIEAAKRIYELYDKGENIVVKYPDAEHDFPTKVREEAYLFIDYALGHNPNIHEME